ncbi:endonuclease YncB(thermonuclease family) [Ulvibacter sp. MAR_2010_11]|uniref:thermonuclease family protein n=1 Tax=Ulvibacter sp. MAR_2010_11 TaxID=1250229 RepID=UPI000C2B9217|nr:thermonuclease family protein [Ulvibacter sp. MAR_2010_11]PKA82448.1 endonuclease YncB(thermonuclease family) [Ulvibacter sp. MAR_2010_11]
MISFGNINPYIFFLSILLQSWLCVNSSGNGTEVYNASFKTDTLTGKVVSITDGDTFKLLTQDSILHRVRLANIDCPEKKQPFSKSAKQFVSDAIFGKEVTITVLSKDRNKRLIANVKYGKGLILNEELLKHGYAWHFVKYSDDPSLQQLEDAARAAKLGLWQDPNPIPPWEWRADRKK